MQPQVRERFQRILSMLVVLTDAFGKMSTEWEWPAKNMMPDEILNLTNAFTSYKAYGVRAAVEYIENSIGYIPYSGTFVRFMSTHKVLDVISSGVLKTTALIENRNGKFVGPEEQYVMAALASSEISNKGDTFINFNDQDGDDSYPFVMMTYVIFRASTNGS